MAKFKLDDVVDFRLGRGKVTHVWPEDRLNGGEQNYFVEKLDRGGTYDVRESEMTLVVPEPAAPPPAPAPITPAETFAPPEPEHAEAAHQVDAHVEPGTLLTNPETRVPGEHAAP